MNNKYIFILFATNFITNLLYTDSFIYNGKSYSSATLQTELEKQSYYSIFSSFFIDQAKQNLAVLAAVQTYRNLSWADKSDRKVLQEILDMHSSNYHGQRTQLAAQYYVITRNNQLVNQKSHDSWSFGLRF